jgi:hypothetical protein
MAKIDMNSSLKRLRNRYRLVVMNDDTYEEVVTFKLSRLSVYTSLCVVFVLLVGLTIALFVYTPLKYYIPGLDKTQSTAELQVLKIRTDSLQQAIQFREQYLIDLQKTLSGNTPTVRDTMILKVPKLPLSNE